MNNNQNNENKIYIRKVYKDKAENLLKKCMVIMFLSILTYILPLVLFKAFDFGLVFEVISLVFIVIAYNKMGQNDFRVLKRYTIIAMIPIGWLIIYDFIDLLANIGEVFIEVSMYYLTGDQFFYYLAPYLVDVLLIASIILLYKTYSSLKKAEGSEPVYDSYEDTFYDKL